MMNNLFIDLETIKCTNQDHIDYIISNIKPYHACKTAESKQKSIDGQVNSVIEKTVFDGHWGQIITIGFAINDEHPVSLQLGIDEDNEKDLLQAFFDYLAKLAENENKDSQYLGLKWIAHNKDFDFKYLFKRCVINAVNTHGIRIPHNDRHGTQHAFCTMQEWKGFGAKAGGSLDSICKALGIEGKKGFCGADVWGSWCNSEFEKIADYCCDDVELTRKIYNRMTFNEK